jgi:hypothetical protein
MTTKVKVGNEYIVSEGLTPPSPTEHFYMAFPIKTDEDAAAKRFAELHGHPPAWIFDSRGLLLAGPVPAKGEIC